MPSFTATPLTPTLGAEIAGLDLKAPVDDATRDALERALAEHLVLVFRNQAFTPAAYLQAAAAFGPPMRQHYSQHNMPEFPDIGLIWHREGQRAADFWHTDHTNRERPPKATLLYGVEIPSTGGDTSVASMRAAHAALPPEEQAALAGLYTLNGLDRDIDDTRAEDRRAFGELVRHPLVRTHPTHGSRALYFHLTKTERIEGMGPAESRQRLGALLERTVTPEIVYRRRWRVGDLWVCDNRATMHMAHDDYDHSQSRVLWRIIVEGDRPFLA